jgi:hypothetical protein
MVIEMKRVWKNTAAGVFKVYAIGTEKKPRKTCVDSRSPGRYLNPGPPEYEVKTVSCSTIFGAVSVKYCRYFS